MSSLVLALLRAFAGVDPSEAQRLGPTVAKASKAELEWTFAAGLGPLLNAALGTQSRSLSSSVRERLLASDLTARVLIEQRVQAALDTIDACQRRGIAVTLLKGISLSHCRYEASHFRPMTDVDVLVSEDDIALLESDLLALGYRRVAPVMGPDSHHAEPLYHPRSGTRVELHHALFSTASGLRAGTVFAADTLRRESHEACFHGRPVLQLSPEFQLVYLASGWARDLCEHSIDPSFVFGLFDAVALARPPFDWARVLDLLDNPLAAASLDVLLVSLVRHRVLGVPEGVLAGVRRRHDLLGAPEVAILRSLVHRYLLGGRRFRACNSWRIWAGLLRNDDLPGLKALKLPWYVAFPPDDPLRFDVATQVARLRRWAATFTEAER